MQQRLYPHGEADPRAYPDAIEQARTLRNAAKSQTFGAWAFAGPTNIGGRVVDLEFNPLEPNIVYAAAATGGVFKSTDTGKSWFPIFDDQAVLSIGDLAIDPVHPGILYVGTGEANGGHNNFAGGGVYKSIDGGLRWTFLGLPETTSIGRIRIDPQNPQRVYLAAVGSYFKANPERGVYRSLDAGASWEQVLFTTETAGAIDLVQNPENPDVLLAAMWDRERTYLNPRLSGTGSGLYRTQDGGDTWERLGEAHGLPAESLSLGRIGLAQSTAHPEVVYALYSTGTQHFGLFKSRDGGDTWTNADPENQIAAGTGGFSWYFGQVRVNPKDTTDVWALDVAYNRTRNAGQSWTRTFGDANLHLDYHALAFHPTNPDVLIIGHDGGISRSENGGESWSRVPILPITQFYEITYDPTNPERLYGGTQDNGTLRTLTGALDDWSQINGGDGFYVIVDPTNPNIVYAESQNGGLVKLVDGIGRGALAGINGREPKNWSTPVVMDPQRPNVLYYGTDRVYQTTNGAEQWTAVSPPMPQETSSILGTVTTIAVAPTDTNTVYAATDDGRVWVTDGHIKNWHDVTSGLPKRWATRVAVDPTDPDIAYLTFSGLKWRDAQPHIFRTRDRGTTWTNISSNLPDAPINALAIDPSFPDILYVGTDVGAFVSLDVGGTWESLGTGLPAVPINDLKINPNTQTLIAGTHGRSMYTLVLDAKRAVAITDSRPAAFTFFPSAPNPFSTFTRLRYRLDAPGTAHLTIHDLQGRLVRTLTNSAQTSGLHTATWNGRDENGSPVAAGVYLARLSLGNYTQTQKLMRVK